MQVMNMRKRNKQVLEFVMGQRLACIAAELMGVSSQTRICICVQLHRFNPGVFTDQVLSSYACDPLLEDAWLGQPLLGTHRPQKPAAACSRKHTYFCVDQVEGVRVYADQALYKEPHGGYTPWHCDAFYWPLATDKAITAWVPLQVCLSAISPAFLHLVTNTDGCILLL